MAIQDFFSGRWTVRTTRGGTPVREGETFTIDTSAGDLAPGVQPRGPISVNYSPDFGDRAWPETVQDWSCHLRANIVEEGRIVGHVDVTGGWPSDAPEPPDPARRLIWVKVKRYDILDEDPGEFGADDGG